MSIPTGTPQVTIESINPTNDADYHILVGDGCGHYGHFSWKNLDASLAEGTFGALNEHLFEVWASELSLAPSLNTLATIHQQARAALKAQEVQR